MLLLWYFLEISFLVDFIAFWQVLTFYFSIIILIWNYPSLIRKLFEALNASFKYMCIRTSIVKDCVVRYTQAIIGTVEFNFDLLLSPCYKLHLHLTRCHEIDQTWFRPSQYWFGLNKNNIVFFAQFFLLMSLKAWLAISTSTQFWQDYGAIFNFKEAFFPPISWSHLLYPVPPQIRHTIKINMNNSGGEDRNYIGNRKKKCSCVGNHHLWVKPKYHYFDVHFSNNRCI